MRRSSILILTFIFAFSVFYSCSQTKYPFGERLFLNKCADCHMDDGNGFTGLYPSLKTERTLDLIETIPCIIRYGITDTSKLIQMLPMPELSEVEITNLINYIVSDLNKSNKQILLTEVQEILLACEK